MGYDIGVAITGHEEVGLTLILTDGFGQMAMSDRVFKLLASLSGRMASINGATQIRAGVMRPEIIIALPESKKTDEEEAVRFDKGMGPGMPVRIIREPYFGAIGVVVALPPELQIVETESSVRVLDVELHDGKKVTVPRANVEIIEE
jgi:transcription antitermination factor NusG